MLSDRCYKGANFLVPKLARIGACKYTWDHKNHIFVKLSPPKSNDKITTFILTFLAIWTIFHFLQIARFYYIGDHSTAVFLFTCLIALIGCIIIYIIVIVWAEVFYPTVNAIIVYMRWINLEYMPNYDPNKSKYVKIVDICVLLTFFVVNSLNLISCTFMFVWSDAPNMFTNVLPRIPWIQRPVNWITLYIVNVGYLCLYFILICANYFGLICVPVIVREFKVGHRSRGKCSNKFRQPINLTIEYRTVQVIMQNVNLFLGKILLPAQFATTLLFIFSAYIVIRHRKQMDDAPFLMMLIWTVLAPSIWSLFLTVGGYLHSHGQAIFNSWKQNEWKSSHERKVMKKFRISSKPIMVCFGKLYVIRRVSLMIYVRGLSRGLIRILLALKTDGLS